MFQNMKIRKKVMFAVIFLSIISLLSMSIPSYFTISRIANYSESVNRELGVKAINGTGMALYVQAQNFLSTIAAGRSNAADIILENIALHANLLEGAVRDIFSNPDHYTGHQIIHASRAVNGTDTSTWMLAEHYELTEEIKREIHLLSNLDMIAPTLKSDPNVLQLYIGMQSGLSYTYSSMLLDDTEFDPRERPWYKEALRHPQEVVFTDAYESAFGMGMTLTAAKAIYDESGELIGVAGLDIKLVDLKNNMLATHFADTGYVFIMDDTGHYIVHPDIDTDSFSHFIENGDVPFASGLKQMMLGERGFVREEVDGRYMYLAFSPMTATNWSVGAVAPEDEILSAKNALSVQMEAITDQAVTDIRHLSDNMLWIFVSIFMLGILMIIIIGMYLTRTISKPISRLATDVSNFGGGEFESRAQVETKDEIGLLADVFNQMADNIVKNMEELAIATTARERLNSELRIAAKIQGEMLPDLTDKFAHHPVVELYATIEPALEMGGDLYDVFFTDKEERKLCAVIADVSGKGVPSAMFMVIAKTLIRNHMLAGENPANTLTKVNNHLCEGNLSNMFITTFISLTDLDTGECQYSHAGHNPVARCPGGSEFYFVKVTPTVPLGYLPGNAYPLCHVLLNPGDKFFHYTDGVTEALDENDVLWGDDALLATLNNYRHCSCREIAMHVRDAVARHSGKAEQSDDITILVLEFANAGEALVIKNNLNELDKIYETLHKISEAYGFPQILQNDLCVCIDEIFSNIVKYAYTDNEEHEIKIKFYFDTQSKKINITIMDDGNPFNPLELNLPDLSRDLPDREIGGLGVFIVSNIMNSVKYSRFSHINKLVMVKDALAYC